MWTWNRSHFFLKSKIAKKCRQKVYALWLFIFIVLLFFLIYYIICPRQRVRTHCDSAMQPPVYILWAFTVEWQMHRQDLRCALPPLSLCLLEHSKFFFQCEGRRKDLERSSFLSIFRGCGMQWWEGFQIRFVQHLISIGN